MRIPRSETECNRRRVLGTLGGSTIIGLAGCSGSDDDADDEETSDTDDDTEPEPDETGSDDGTDEETGEEEEGDPDFVENVRDVSAPEEIAYGEDIPVSITIENTGDGAGEATIEFEATIDGEYRVIAEETETIQAGERDTFEYEYEWERAGEIYIRANLYNGGRSRLGGGIAGPINIDPPIEVGGTVRTPQGEARHAGNLPTHGPTGDVDVLWEGQYDVQATPVIHEGTLVVADHGLDSDIEGLRVIDAASGDVLWDRRVQASTVAIDEETVYCVASDGEFDHTIGFERESEGEERFNKRTNKVQSNFRLWDETLYYTRRDVRASNTGYRVEATNTFDGSRRWNTSAERVTEFGNVQEEWGFSQLSISPSNNFIYAAEGEHTGPGDERDDGRVSAYDAGIGEQRWETDVSDRAGMISSDEDSVYAVTEDGVLHALDAENGSQEWTFDMVTGNGYMKPPESGTSPVIADETVYVPDQDNQLYAVNKDSGDLVWREDLRASIQHVLLADGVIYAATTDRVLGLDAESGAELWEYIVSFNESWTRIKGITVADGVVFVGTEEGLIALTDRV